MKVELELEVAEEDESVVMKKISEVARYAKERGFRVDEIEIERDDDNEDEQESEDEDADVRKSARRKSRKRKRKS